MKRAAPPLLFALVTMIALGACDGSDVQPFVPRYDPSDETPVAQTEFCALLALNTCAVLRPCCSGSPFAFDEPKCRLAARAQCETRRVKSAELGLRYDDTQAGRCVRGMVTLLRDCRTVKDDAIASDVAEACRMVWHGDKKVGTLCEAKNLLDCAPPALGARVTCRFGICQRVPILNGGDDCLAEPAACGSGLQCEGVPPSPRRCTAIVSPVGAPCSPFGKKCADELFCDTVPTTPICTPLPSIGQKCTQAAGCGRGARCDVDRAGETVCIEGKALGAACNDNKECGTKLCAGIGLAKVCVPSGFDEPIANIRSRPDSYLVEIAAACSGVLPRGGGSLAPISELRDPGS